MSKSSSTNYPNGFLTKSLSHLLIVSSLTECDGSAARIAASHGFRYTKRQVLLGGYSSEVPPLPIPNREVKLTHADGTAFCGGRVGSRLFKPNPIRVRLFCVYMCVREACGHRRGQEEMQSVRTARAAASARGGPQLLAHAYNAVSAGCAPKTLC